MSFKLPGVPNVEEMILSRVKREYHDHPEIKKDLDLAVAAAQFLDKLLANVDPAKVQAAAELLNREFSKEPLPEAEIVAGVEALQHAPEALHALEAGIGKIEKILGE